jgi:dihydroxyacetone kinase
MLHNFSAGTLVFIPNYTGDCLNFGLAVEWAKSEGLKVTEFYVNLICEIMNNFPRLNIITNM